METKPNGKLGLIPCVAIIVGGCIGSAIYSLSGMTMYYAGASAILSWVIAALILVAYGMMVAELSVRYPKSGGIFVFPEKALGYKNRKTGEFWGFISAWGYIVSNTIAIAFSAIYVATYLGFGIPPIGALFGSANQVVLAVIAVAIALGLNLLKITDAGKYNNLLVGFLALTMFVYIGFACFGGSFTFENFKPFFTVNQSFGASGFIRAIPVAAVAYGACVAIAFMVSEVENPNRTVPRSLLIGLSIVCGLYLLMIIATLGNLNPAILQSDENAFFRYVPMFAAVMTSGLGQYANILNPLIAVSAFLALLTTMLVLMALNSRAVQACAEAGYLPKPLSKESKNGVPAAATVVVGVIAMLISCKPDWTEILVGLGALFSIVSMIITVWSLIVSRKNVPHVEGQYRAPGGSALPVIAIVVMTLIYLPDVISGDWKLWAFTGIIYAIAVAIFFAASGRKKA